MVRALLAGTKTQTRRLVKPQPDVAQAGRIGGLGLCGRFTPDDERLGRFGKSIPCPYGGPGDRLWVRETWGNGARPGYDPAYLYRADDSGREGWATPPGMKWRPSIHMPRGASRITLEVTEVRVERLQDISEADSQAEGIFTWAASLAQDDDIRAADIEAMKRKYGVGLRSAYGALWDSINGDGSWDANPWVWCVSFRRAGAA